MNRIASCRGVIAIEYQGVEALRIGIARLERRMRLIVAGWVFSVAAFVLFGVIVQHAASQPTVLRVRRIEVIDAVGRTRIELNGGSVADGRPWLRLMDPEGQKRFELTGEGRPEWSPWLTIADAKGEATVELTESWLRFWDSTRQRRIFIGVGYPGLTPEGVVRLGRIGLAVLPDGTSWVLLGDASNRSRIGLVVARDGMPGLTLRDSTGRVLFRAP